MMDKTRRPNWPLLAAVRFGLAFIVMGCHIGWRFRIPWLAHGMGLLSADAAVRGFLFISGFSIAHSITSKPRGYLLRRLHRIYPTYLLCFAIAVAPFALWGDHVKVGVVAAPMPTWPALLGNLFMLQTLAVPRLSTMAQNWTLAVECLFYLLAPFFMRLPLRWLLVGCGASAALFYCHGLLNLPPWWASIGPLAPCGLLWAWLGGWLLYKAEGAERLWVLLGIVAVSGAECANDGRGSLLTAAVVLFALTKGHTIRLPALPKRVAIYAGDISYPLYLIHFVVMAYLVHWTAQRNGWLAIAASLAVSALVLHTVNATTWLAQRFVRQPQTLPMPATSSVAE
jgi:peptidoglycan/LPS O-acetylase OafA/YrhL